jgi:nucleoid-associated protein YgaU
MRFLIRVVFDLFTMGTNAEFNLRFTKKMIEKEAAAAEKKYDASRKKALDALKKSGDVETARIYAETAVQNRTSYNQFLIMASRIDSIISKVRSFLCQAMFRSSLDFRRFNKQMHRASW